MWSGARLGVDGSGGQIGDWEGQVRLSRGQIRRLGPGESRRLRVGSDGMGAGTKLGSRGGATQEQVPDWGPEILPREQPYLGWGTRKWKGYYVGDRYQTVMGYQIGMGYQAWMGYQTLMGTSNGWGTRHGWGSRQWMGDQRVDGILDSRCDTILWMGYQIMGGIPDRGGVPGRVPI